MRKVIKLHTRIALLISLYALVFGLVLAGCGTVSNSPSEQPDAPDTTSALEQKLADTIWELHADNGEIASKYTFDATGKTFRYWKGDADPTSGTGNYYSGHYTIYFDDDAYEYVDDASGNGSQQKALIEDHEKTLGEPVHYFILLAYPEAVVKDGVESPRDDSEPIVWEGVWMTESKHIRILNYNSMNQYDMYDATVPVEDRETARTRIYDTKIDFSDPDNPRIIDSEG